MVASRGLEIWVLWTSFQKSNISWPQQPPTGNVSTFFWDLNKNEKRFEIKSPSKPWHLYSIHSIPQIKLLQRRIFFHCSNFKEILACIGCERKISRGAILQIPCRVVRENEGLHKWLKSFPKGHSYFHDRDVTTGKIRVDITYMLGRICPQGLRYLKI